MKNKTLKKLVAGVTVGALCALPFPAFAGGGTLGGVPATGTWYNDIKYVDARAVDYRTLYKTSFEDGTWNLINATDVFKDTEDLKGFTKFDEAVTMASSAKFVEAGLQDLPLDFGTYTIYDIKYRQNTADGVEYAVKYAPKVTNALFRGENVNTASIGYTGVLNDFHTADGFKQSVYDSEDFSEYDDKILIRVDIGDIGAFAKVGERVWIPVYGGANPEEENCIYLFICDEDNYSMPDVTDFGVNTTNIVGCKLHIEDKSYRNFESVKAEDSLSNTVALNVNGEELGDENNSPFIHEGTTMVPLRLAASAVGADVKYEEGNDQLGNRIKLSKDSSNIELFTKSALMYKGETNINKMSMAPVIVNGTSYVPVRAIAEALGCEVGFDSETKTVLINS